MVSSDDADEYEEREAVELQERMAATLSEADFLSIQSLGPLETSKVGVYCVWAYVCYVWVCRKWRRR